MSDLDLSDCELTEEHLEVIVQMDGELAKYAQKLLDELNTEEG
ncbi:hypothetical protein [Halorientalis sp. IM1011]|nr:hypothetical protein [Halorientalis sp. IM1011]